ncbi:MAG: alpha/beta hydrolase fold domain-containing protein [Planctomycetota bacterium]
MTIHRAVNPRPVVLRFTSLTVLSLTLFPVPCGEASPALGYTPYLDLTYATVTDDHGNLVDLALDLYVPTGPGGPWPVVVWIHGGAWLGGDKSNTPALFLTEHGFAVASINYRLSWQSIWPAQIHDCKGAVRWLRANAAAYDLDPDRFGAWGSSAGGHLTAHLAATGDEGVVRIGSLTIDVEGSTGGNLSFSSRVGAAVDWFGPTHFGRLSQFPSPIDHDAPDSPEALLLGAAIQTVPELVASADPATFLTRDDPPYLIAHGTADPTVAYDQSEYLWRTANETHGLGWTFLPVLDGGHGGPGFDTDPVASWFETHLRDLPDVTVGVASTGRLAEDGSEQGLFTVSRTGSSASRLAVHIAWDGVAQNGVDVAALPTVVWLEAGETSKDLNPAVIDDLLVEGVEGLELRLVPSPDHRIDSTASIAELELLDDEDPGSLPVVELLAVDQTATEGGADEARFQLRRAGSVSEALEVPYGVRGSAMPGVDHDLVSGMAEIPVGSTSVDLVLHPIDDALLEATELFLVELLASELFALGADHAQSGPLFDDEYELDLPRIGMQTRVIDLVEEAPPAALELTRTGGTRSPLTVDLDWIGEALDDLAPLPESVTFAVGKERVSVDLSPNDPDAVPEADQWLEGSVRPGSGYLPASVSRRDLFLIDDDTDSVPAPEGVMRVGSLALGALVSIEVEGDPEDRVVMLAGTDRAFLPLFGSALLVDLATALILPLGRVGPEGVLMLAFSVPEIAELAERWVSFQALRLSAVGQPVLTNRVDRRIAPAPLPSPSG